MYLSIDDTDSRSGGCTTYILTEIIKRSRLFIEGFPRLVRLNPSIPWKTRGNGALSVSLITSGERGEKIGEIDGIDYFSCRGNGDNIDPDDLIEIAAEAIYDLSELEEEGTNPGIVVSERRPEPELYYRTVRGVMETESVRKYLEANGMRYLGIKNARGVIGAAASMAWEPGPRTYEAILYKFPSSVQIPHEKKMMASMDAQRIPGTFNNVDLANRYAAIFPKERTPVILGVRSTDPGALLSSVKGIAEKYSIGYERAMIFETNQGTDDHIISEPDILEVNRNYGLGCRILSYPKVISGSHYFVDIDYRGNKLKAAAFEPTKEFRKVFGLLAPGDEATIYGTFSGWALNVEKMEVRSMSKIFVRVPPECSRCKLTMENHGIRDYRCRACGNRSSLPEYREKPRENILGKHDVPVIARRHLSKPFSLEGKI